MCWRGRRRLISGVQGAEAAPKSAVSFFLLRKDAQRASNSTHVSGLEQLETSVFRARLPSTISHFIIC